MVEQPLDAAEARGVVDAGVDRAVAEVGAEPSGRGSPRLPAGLAPALAALAADDGGVWGRRGWWPGLLGLAERRRGLLVVVVMTTGGQRGLEVLVVHPGRLRPGLAEGHPPPCPLRGIGHPRSMSTASLHCITW